MAVPSFGAAAATTTAPSAVATASNATPAASNAAAASAASDDTFGASNVVDSGEAADPFGDSATSVNHRRCRDARNASSL